MSGLVVATTRRNREQVRCLQLGLLPLKLRIGPPGDACARTKPQLWALSPEGSDTAGKLALPPFCVDPADRTAIGPARRRLQLSNDAQCAGLGCSGHRSGWEGCVHDLGPPDLRPQPA